ncbi:MAG: FmdE family protein [Bacillota bacterium]
MQNSFLNWKMAVEFHGHACPGLAYGVRASEIGLELLNCQRSGDEEILAIVETDACSVDGIQVVAGCTFGKGNLIFRDFGKQAFTFARRDNGEAVRMVMKRVNIEDRQEKIKFILEGPQEEICTVQRVKVQLPEKAKIFNSIRCEECGESFMESRGRLQDGKIVCLSCFQEYKR